MEAGRVLAGRYRVDRLIGRGGMGEVWQGFDPRLDRPVAIKLLLASGTVRKDQMRRFEREARIAARLQHPGITAVHDFGHDGAQMFVVMELLRGRDLAAVLEEHPCGLPLEQVVQVAAQAAGALAFAHAQRVVHRDLKPANLFWCDIGQVKICDFGIARIADALPQITATGAVVGTPAFMPPEQWEGKDIDERSDVYAFGCLLHTLLTGRVPFTGSFAALMRQHLTQPPPPLHQARADLPAALADLITQMMAKPPADRPPSSDLPTLLAHATPSSLPSSPPQKTRDFPTRLFPTASYTRPAPPAPQHTTSQKEQRYRHAAQNGDTAAMVNVGVLLEERGERGEAESWYRRAAQAGHTDAIVLLGALLYKRGEAGEAEQWLRRAAEADYTGAMVVLGVLLYKRGEAGEAEQWLRRAAENGDTRAMFSLGVLLEERGERGEAESRYRKAADAGHAKAMNNVGVLLEERGEVGEAERWYQRAAEVGHPYAMRNLAQLLEARGRAAEATEWRRRAGEG